MKQQIPYICKTQFVLKDTQLIRGFSAELAFISFLITCKKSNTIHHIHTKSSWNYVALSYHLIFTIFYNHLSVCPIQVDPTQDTCVCVDPIHSSFPGVEVHQDGISHTRWEPFLIPTIQVDPENDVSEANEQIRLGIFTQNHISITSLILLTITYIKIYIPKSHTNNNIIKFCKTL